MTRTPTGTFKVIEKSTDGLEFNDWGYWIVNGEIVSEGFRWFFIPIA